VLDLDETPYNQYLKGIPAAKTHSGYFSIDKKTKRLVTRRGARARTRASPTTWTPTT
jgi:hypothetical protein